MVRNGTTTRVRIIEGSARVQKKAERCRAKERALWRLAVEPGADSGCADAFPAVKAVREYVRACARPLRAAERRKASHRAGQAREGAPAALKRGGGRRGAPSST